MSFEFLSVDAARPAGGRTPLARSPMERVARAAGARFEERDGWNVAVASEAGGCSWTDLSHLGKLELHGSPAALGIALDLGTAMRDGETWWCPVTRGRTLAICPSGATAALRTRLEETAGTAAVVEVTTAYAALAISGPLAREVFARFCAIDLRPAVMPVGAFRPGSIARTPGMVLREAEDRYLMLFGAALGEYMWTVVSDAAEGADA
ncbi:MAG TPA: sarcosine oxidase subunit gamma family protein [Solirubrobacteraceae bacterium]|nr:sarcosine oxidase subunit gamma family protein [Solirubrobacteraceae bacterium]